MVFGVERYQQVKGPITLNQQGQVVAAAPRSGSPGPQEALRIKNEDAALAQAFLSDLERSGRQIAHDAMRNVLGYYGERGVLQGTQRLKHGDRAAILEKAQQLRAGMMRSNERAAWDYLGTTSTSQSFLARHVALAPPGVDTVTPALKRAVLVAVRRHQDFAQAPMNRQTIRQVADDAIREFYIKENARFAEAFPGLASVRDGQQGNQALLDRLEAELDRNAPNPNPGAGSVRREAANFLDDGLEALRRVRSSQGQLGRMEFNPATTPITLLRQQLVQHVQDLGTSQLNLGQANPATQRGQDLRNALMVDLQHQSQLLTSRIQFLDAFIANDPLSNAAVAHNDLVWAHAQGVVIDDLIAEVLLAQPPLPNAATLINGDPGATPGSLAHRGLLGWKNDLAHQATQVLTNAIANPQRSAVPPSFSVGEKTQVFFGTKQPHPFDIAASNAKQALRAGLATLGFNPTDVQRASESLEKARVKALDTAQAWQPVSQAMPVTRNNLTRTYTSEIVPARQLGGAVGRSYVNAGLHGVSAANRDDANHARNLQVSRLTRPDPVTNQPKVLSQSVRHGVIDAWMIPTATARTQANQRAATEVLTTAVEHTTPRAFKDALLAKAAAGIVNQPGKLTHVNFNLTTPSPTREFGTYISRSKDYREWTFTDSQFRAFEALQGAQTFTIDDDRNPVAVVQNQPVRVDVDTITFSFGVNDFAMGNYSAAFVVVDAHNTENMRKLVGDLAVKTPPNGVVGETIRKIDAALQVQPAPVNASELERLRQALVDQTDVVREIFNKGGYKSSHGDPYQMVRHTMRLVDTSALALAALGDPDAAITVSQGCKSGKDRGGMADVENKAQAIIEDMGGTMVPEVAPTGEDGVIYRTVGAMSGQSRVQQQNTGLPGSKNASEVEARIGDADALAYMKGYADQAKA
ncbi:MAG: hypothetical protein JOY64_02760 [Alphaproteobacteria bacterium]|nr:hypothetical protein [Alphaproteobacteria bacterium]